MANFREMSGDRWEEVTERPDLRVSVAAKSCAAIC